MGGRISFLLLAWAVSAIPAHAEKSQGWDCSLLLRTEGEQIAKLKPGFFDPSASYAYERPSSSPRSQGNLGTCWLFCGVAGMEHTAKLDGQPVTVSESYLVAHALRLKAEAALSKPASHLKMGGFAYNFEGLVKQVGVVPAEAWSPRVLFFNDPTADRLENLLDTRIAQFHLSGEPETLDQAKSDILAIIEAFTGPLPSDDRPIRWKGLQLTPQEWAAKLEVNVDFVATRLSVPEPENLPAHLASLPSARSENRYTAPDPFSVTPERRKTVTVEELGAAVAEAVHKNVPVFLSIEIQRSLIDTGTGAMTIQGFHLPEGYEVIPRAYRRHFDRGGGMHAIEVVGVDYNADGSIKRFKLRNSWGTAVGTQGYYHLYWDYFQEFIRAATFIEPPG